MSQYQVSEEKKALKKELLRKFSEYKEQLKTNQDFLNWKDKFKHDYGYYSFRNLALIFFQKPDATDVKGFHNWIKAGRAVRKGEKGLMILVPIWSNKNKSEVNAVHSGIDKPTNFISRYVFDISQTEPIEKLAEVGTI
jgi:hypothetical protein